MDLALDISFNDLANAVRNTASISNEQVADEEIMAADKGFFSIEKGGLNDQRPDSKDGRSINAPEVDTSVLAPQVHVLREGLQVV